jgi:hypothetical protein
MCGQVKLGLWDCYPQFQKLSMKPFSGLQTTWPFLGTFAFQIFFFYFSFRLLIRFSTHLQSMHVFGREFLTFVGAGTKTCLAVKITDLTHESLLYRIGPLLGSIIESHGSPLLKVSMFGVNWIFINNCIRIVIQIFLFVRGSNYPPLFTIYSNGIS